MEVNIIMFKNLIKKCEKAYTSILTTLALLLTPVYTYAADQPKIISGTVKLASDATLWLLLIIPGGIGAFIGWQSLKKGMTEEQGEIAHYNKNIKNAAIAGVIAVSADALIKLILSYYQG